VVGLVASDGRFVVEAPDDSRCSHEVLEAAIGCWKGLTGWRHDIQHSDTQYNVIQRYDIKSNDTRHNNTQHNDT
jgi:hypothetical protein